MYVDSNSSIANENVHAKQTSKTVSSSSFSEMIGKKTDEDTKKNSDIAFDMSKPFDINTFTFEDYKNISATDLSGWIQKGESSALVKSQANVLNGIASFTEDDVLNEVLFDKAKESFDRTGDIKETIETILFPVTAMKIEPLTSIPSRNVVDSKAYNENDYLKPYEIYNDKIALYDSKDILNQMKESILYVENPPKNVKFETDMNSVLKSMNDILNEYEKRSNESNAILANYTKNI